MATEQERIDRMEAENIDLKIRVSILETDVKTIKADISSIKDDTKWLRRSITGSFITAGAVVVIGFIVFAIQHGGGI